MRLGLDIAESLRISLSALVANRARGLLTALGIIIGIVAVVTTMTAANGLAENFRSTFSAIGADVLYVRQFPFVITDGDAWRRYQRRPPLELEHSEDLARALRGQAIVNPTISTSRDVRYGSSVLEGARILGTTERQLLVSSAAPGAGRFIMPVDVQYRRAVAVIGWEVGERLFGARDPIGEKLRIGRHVFRVIGVMEKQGSGGVFGGPNFDLQVFVPVSTFAKTFGSRGRDIQVSVAVKPLGGLSVTDLEYETVGEMRKIRKLRPAQEDDFSINKLDTLLTAYNNVMGVVYGIGLLITGIALFVGGVGVMNIMFVSVTERTREIGIRKALGARRRSILMQLMFEAAIICLAGGLIGLLLAWLVTLTIDAFLLPASLSWGIATTAVVISILVGMLSGIAPAWRGARQDPIDALRYE
jgi:putative ABC transport system permease protein